MRHKIFPLNALLGAALCVALSSCGDKRDAATEMERAAQALEQAEAPAPAVVQPPPAHTQPAPPVTAGARVLPPAQQMNQALTSYKAGNYEDAVTRLQKLRATPAMSPQQRIALQDAIAAVMTDVYAMAEKGDARAIQAVRQYQQMQMQHPRR